MTKNKISWPGWFSFDAGREEMVYGSKIVAIMKS
jgi:hypothetical protein